MMFIALATIIAMTGPGPSPAPTPTLPLKPLRTLVYHVDYVARTRLEMRGSGLPQDSPDGLQGSHGPASGTGNETRDIDTDNRGDLRIDVIAVTADGGAVIDIRLDGTLRSQPPVRVALASDGSISFDPKSPLAPEAATLAPLFSPMLLGNHGLAVGDRWSVGWQPPNKGTTQYDVAAISDDRATLHAKEAGASGNLQRASDATIVYAVRQLNPISVHYTGIDRNFSSFATYRTDRVQIDAELASDSFAKR